MKSWISSRTNKPASRPPGEVAEVVKEAEAITATDVEIVVVEVVAAVVVVVEDIRLHQERRKRSKQLKPGPAVNTTAVS
jgi:hypothetical protein